MRRIYVLALLLITIPSASSAADGFYLRNQDRVVFYGDSITEQRLYTTFVETYVVTRFPKMPITFVHSGWGGDRVSGGGGGPIDLRLKRDVFAYKPTVMTIMLGMNDGSYQSFNESIFNTYSKGMENIVAKVKEAFPQIRITLIQPSPFDDVTRKPGFDKGYNDVLVRFGEFLKGLASRTNIDVADMNTPVVEATKKAFAIDPKEAVGLNPDRVHPGPGGQLLMAAALLDAWHAPAVVSDVEIEVEGVSVESEAKNAKVSELRLEGGKLSWSQLDEALPFPIDYSDKATALALRASDIVDQLNKQTLEVEGLAADKYVLKIDGSVIGHFTKQELAEGINLATMKTPMVEQARKVHELTIKHNEVHFRRWRSVEVSFQDLDSPHIAKALAELDAFEGDLVKDQRETAQPKSHKFELEPEN